ncbi:MAG TPA: WYL domain-containing protein [Victivallales bacterium]|nr:WYL domain-containing protein [Victivallales bacterium]
MNFSKIFFFILEIYRNILDIKAKLDALMAKGFSKKVIERLYETFSHIRDGKKRYWIVKNLYNGDKRLYASDFSKLRKTGIKFSHSRKTDTYKIKNWPDSETFSFRFTKTEFFKVFIIASEIGEHDIKERLALALSDETDAVYDVGPAYGISQNITGEIAQTLATLKDAIKSRKKLVIRYRSLSLRKESNRVVHPYKLIHTPISWYLVAWCETINKYWTFKLARISEITTLQDKFKRRENFNLNEILGDAWWIRHDKNKKPYNVKVLFLNEAAQSIREYKFHKTQKLEFIPDGTLASWQLSYLDEFACWLLQWLGNIKIIEPTELKKIISQKINNHLKIKNKNFSGLVTISD